MDTNPPPQQNQDPDNIVLDTRNDTGLQWRNDSNPPKQRHSRHKALLVTGVMSLLFAAVAAATWILNREPTCLNDDDYRVLTGTSRTDPLSSQTSFWSDIIYFAPNSVSYDNSSTTATTVLTTVGAFARTHTDKSLIISVSGDYYEDSQLALTQQRIATVRAGLIAAGASASSVQLVEPTYISMDDDETNGNDINSPVTITITSVSTCK